MNPLRLHAEKDASTPIDRRTFLKAMSATGAGLTLGIFAVDTAAQVSGPGKTSGTAAAAEFASNAFLRIMPDNTVTVLVKHVEMGQASYTRLPTLLSEEL